MASMAQFRHNPTAILSIVFGHTLIAKRIADIRPSLRYVTMGRLRIVHADYPHRSTNQTGGMYGLPRSIGGRSFSWSICWANHDSNSKEGGEWMSSPM